MIKLSFKTGKTAGISYKWAPASANRGKMASYSKSPNKTEKERIKIK